MTYPAKTRENQIAIALKQCAASVKQAGNGHWEFTLANGKPLGVSARLFENWLLLDAPLTDRIARGGSWDLLRMNATLQGLSKFVLMPDARSVHLRADIPLAGDEDSESDCASEVSGILTTRLLDTCSGLKEGFRRFRGDKPGDHQARMPPVSGDDRTLHGADVFRSLCADTEWSFVERSQGKLMIDLDVRNGFYQASVQQREDGTEVAVEIGCSEVLGETNRQALSLLLLVTGGLVRLARPSVEETENRITARFEVKFTTTPTANELAHAFASLSVACALSGREARALQDDVVARDYLAMLEPRPRAQASLPAIPGSRDYTDESREAGRDACAPRKEWRSQQWERHNYWESDFK